jgi:hypothetical protein
VAAIEVTVEKGVGDLPGNKNLMLRTMSLTPRSVDTLATLFGGHGTIKGSSRSPSSLDLAPVSYQIVPQ